MLSRTHSLIFVSLVVFSAAQVLVPNAVRAAAKPPANSCPQTPSRTTPMPVRPVLLGKVGTQVFSLPGGAPADISTDLATVLLSSVAESAAFAPSDTGGVGRFENAFGVDDPCQEHLEIRSAVSTFQLNIVELKLSIGYTPGGQLGPITGLNGNVHVKVGAISMDFSIWKCSQGRCSAVAASTSSHAVASGGLEFTIDFGPITTGPSLIANSPLGAVFRAMMRDGISQLAKSPRVNELPWRARVVDSVPAVGSMILNVGVQDRIGVNQAFEIYAPTSSGIEGVCNVYKTEAIVHTVSTEAVSSAALIDEVRGGATVKAGDVVMIHYIK